MIRHVQVRVKFKYFLLILFCDFRYLFAIFARFSFLNISATKDIFQLCFLFENIRFIVIHTTPLKRIK